jgi:hypothetical protein
LDGVHGDVLAHAADGAAAGRERDGREAGIARAGSKGAPFVVVGFEVIAARCGGAVSAWIAFGLGLLGPATASMEPLPTFGALGLMIGRSPSLRCFP